MAYQFTQTGAEIQGILDQVGINTGDISSLNATLTNFTFARMDCAQAVSKGGTGTTITIVFSQSGVTNGTCLVLAGSSLYLVQLGSTPTVTKITGSETLTATFDSGTLTFTLTHSGATYLGVIAMGNAGKYATITVS